MLHTFIYVDGVAKFVSDSFIWYLPVLCLLNLPLPAPIRAECFKVCNWNLGSLSMMSGGSEQRDIYIYNITATANSQKLFFFQFCTPSPSNCSSYISLVGNTILMFWNTMVPGYIVQTNTSYLRYRRFYVQWETTYEVDAYFVKAFGTLLRTVKPA